jgi:NAD(P)-dependent dehydrogenase (short-subunit alcohol dehydrogenase family)
MSLYGMFKGPGPSGFGYTSTAEDVSAGLDLSGQRWLVTGVNSGLGAETARVLALRGATVLGAARTQEKADAAIAGLGNGAIGVACELSEPASVRAAVAAVASSGSALDGIIANAGIMALPKRTVQHGVELQVLTNHIGHFILIKGLLDRLKAEGRVVVLSSDAHFQTYKEGVRVDDLDASGGYSSWGAYGQSKLCNLLFVRSLARRLPAGQTTYAVHPGVISTNLVRHMSKVVSAVFDALGPALVLKSIPEGAATQVYCAVHPDAPAHNGVYWADCNPKRPSKFGQDDDLAEALWAKTEAIVADL